MDWTELLDPMHGGPGEPPGRPELIQQLQDEKALQGELAPWQHPSRRKSRAKKKPR